LESGFAGEAWEGGDAETLTAIIGCCLQVGVDTTLSSSLDKEARLGRQVQYRTMLLELGAGLRWGAAFGETDTYVRHEPLWAEARGRAASFCGGKPAAPFAASTGGPRALPPPSVESRALCSWALEQDAVREVRDAASLVAALRGFLGPAHSYRPSSPAARAHYQRVMSASQWEEELAEELALQGGSHHIPVRGHGVEVCTCSVARP
jgi:hypothetical protein